MAYGHIMFSTFVCLFVSNICTFSVVLPYPVSRIDLSLPLPPSSCWLHTDLDPLQDTKETRLASLARKGAIIPSLLATLRKHIKRWGDVFSFCPV